MRPRRGRGGTVPNRLQWALGLDPDNLDFYHSVLSDSRDRLQEEGRADRLLDLVMARLMEAEHGRRSNRRPADMAASPAGQAVIAPMSASPPP